MEKTFWIPIILSISSLVWNYIQSKKIIKLETEAERENLIHKFQFEKEFNVYTDLWSKLIDLRNSTAALRPSFDFIQRDKTELEIKNDRLLDQWNKLIAVVETFDKNMSFYSNDIYKEIESLIRIARSEAIDYRHKKNHSNEYWEKAEENINTIINSMDKIALLIRNRIEVVEITA